MGEGPSDAEVAAAVRKDEEYYRRCCELLDAWFGDEIVAAMSPEVRSAFERLGMGRGR